MIKNFIKKIALALFLLSKDKFKIKPIKFGIIMNGIGIGIISNTLFLITTGQDFDTFRLFISFIFAIIIIAIGSIQRKDKDD